MSDAQISGLIECPKIWLEPLLINKLTQGQHQISLQLLGLDTKGSSFVVYLRQNLRKGMSFDFSCGIRLETNGQYPIHLRRYNGPSHNHYNQIEKKRIGYQCHIHMATSKYINAGLKPEGYAESTQRFNSLRSAFSCLILDCNIKKSKHLTNLIEDTLYL
ncbi:MAG: hypothetical protein ACKOBI_10310 [Bacteroidota bacterium]